MIGPGLRFVSDDDEGLNAAGRRLLTFIRGLGSSDNRDKFERLLFQSPNECETFFKNLCKVSD